MCNLSLHELFGRSLLPLKCFDSYRLKQIDGSSQPKPEIYMLSILEVKISSSYFVMLPRITEATTQEFLFSSYADSLG